MITALYMVSGVALLFFGAEWLVKGSTNLAIRVGIPSLVVGLTIVALGTSAPELAVSVRAGLNGLGDIAVSNVVGSNIFNIAVILGISALIHPIKVNVQVLRVDTAIMVGVSMVLWYLLQDSTISRIEGVFLTAAIVTYTIMTIFLGKRSARSHSEVSVGKELKRVQAQRSPLLLNIALIVLGLAALVVGSRFFVTGAITLAQFLGVSEVIIGLTIIAAGTSLPELATSIVAAAKGEEDIAIGNIVGSNIFNILGILGISGALTPLTASGIGFINLAFMTGTAIVLLPLMRTGFKIVRIEGIILLLLYAGYLWYLWPK